jgi:nucleoside-diphosphate-sugar epimerase
MANLASHHLRARFRISGSQAVRRVLVTGAGGFIGRHCLPILLAKGYDVQALSRGKPAKISPGVVWHALNLLAPGAPAQIIQKVKPDCLLHLAWYAVPGKFWDAPENIDWVRASGELLSAFAANNGTRAVAAGSCAEYQLNAGECIEEKTPLNPATLYGTCKNEFAQRLDSLSRETGFSSAWGRIFFLYGPHEPRSRLVAYVVQSLLRAEPALCSDGKQILDFLHVEDVASAFVALLESEIRGPVNIASGRPLSVKDLLQEISVQLGRPDLIRLGAREATSNVSHVWANVGRLSNEVSWKPRYDLQSGIRQTIEWCRSSTRSQTLDPTEQAK